MSIILLVKVLISIVVSITAISTTAVSNGYLWGRPLPYFSSSCGLASGDSWGSASKGTSLASLIGSCGLTLGNN